MRIIICIMMLCAVLWMSGCDNVQPTVQSTEITTELVDAIEVADANEAIRFTQEQLTEDLDQMLQLIQQHHPQRFTDEEVLAQRIQHAKDGLRDGMTAHEFLRTIVPVVSALNCGHTRLILPEVETSAFFHDGRGFPLRIAWVDGQLFNVDDRYGDQIPAGAQIVSINGMSSDEVTNRLLSALSADGTNITFKYWVARRYFQWMLYQYVDTADRFTIEYRVTSDDAVESITMEGISSSAYWPNTSRPGLYSSKIKDDYALLQFTSFQPHGSVDVTDYQDYMDQFFRRLDEQSTPVLILDVRGNDGGDPRVTSHLLSYLAHVSQPYFSRSAPGYYPGLKSGIPLQDNHFDGSLYILMDGMSFSSTGHLLALLQQQNVGILVGEESGGGAVCTDSSRSATLHHTDLQFRYSTEVWGVDAPDVPLGQGIMPDIPIVYTVADYIENNDPVMDAVLEMIQTEE